MKLDRDTWLSDVMGWEVQRINLSTEDTNTDINSLNSEFQSLALGIPRSKNMYINIENMFIKSSFSAQEIRTFRGILKRLRNPKKINKDN